LELGRIRGGFLLRAWLFGAHWAHLVVIVGQISRGLEMTLLNVLRQRIEDVKDSFGHVCGCFCQSRQGNFSKRWRDLKAAGAT